MGPHADGRWSRGLRDCRATSTGTASAAPRSTHARELVAKFRSTVSAEASALATMLSAVDIHSQSPGRLLYCSRARRPADPAGGGAGRRRPGPVAYRVAQLRLRARVRELLHDCLTTSMTFGDVAASDSASEATRPDAARLAILFAGGNSPRGRNGGRNSGVRVVVKNHLPDAFTLDDASIPFKSGFILDPRRSLEQLKPSTGDLRARSRGKNRLSSSRKLPRSSR